MDRYPEEKVKKCEEFIDRQLKPHLADAIANRDSVLERQKILIWRRMTSSKTLVNLGSEVYTQAEPWTCHIFVDIGLGFHAEFTWHEALCYTSAREEWLARQLEERTHKIASIKAQIKIVCDGIWELLQIPE